MNNTLHGLGVLVTRPQHQAQALGQAITAHGGHPILFPSLAIVPIDDNTLLTATLAALDTLDYAIFTSANAVYHTQAAMAHAALQLPVPLIRCAIGPATCDAMQAAGWAPVLLPDADYSSAGVLQLAELQRVNDKRIAIFTGAGGLDQLAPVLRSRGALVSVVPTYRRIQPLVAIDPLLEKWQRGKVQVVVSTSGEALHNLYAMLGEVGRRYWCTTPLLVTSARLVSVANAYARSAPVLVTRDATDSAILMALIDYAARNPAT